MNLEPNMHFFITKVLHFIHDVRRRITTIYKRGVKQIIMKEYKGRFFDDCVEFTSFIQAQRGKHAYFT